MRGKARPGSTHSSAAEEGTRVKTMYELLTVPLHMAQGVTLSTGSKKPEEKIFYNHTKQLIQLFFFHI